MLQSKREQLYGKPTWRNFTTDDYPHKSKVKPPTCPESCKTCWQHFVPRAFRELGHQGMVYRPYTDTEAATFIHDLVETTKANYCSIRNAIKQHGYLISKKWLKLTGPQRKALILKVRPNMLQHKNAQLGVLFQKMQQNIAFVKGRTPKEDLMTKNEETNLIP